MKRGQSAVEFMAVLGILVFFFTLFFATIQSHKGFEIEKKERVAINNVALSIKDEIVLAKGSVSGYYREFKTPENIFGEEYNLNITSGFIYISTEDNGVAYKTIDVTGNLVKGVNYIRNENGTIFINQ
jgi:hypothetical protein